MAGLFLLLCLAGYVWLFISLRSDHRETLKAVEREEARREGFLRFLQEIRRVVASKN
jgi:hypothetical protein